MIAFYENILDKETATLTSSSSHSAYPLSNLLNDRLTERVKLSSGIQYIQVDVPSDIAVDSVCIAGANFTTGVLQISDDDFASIKESFNLTDAENKNLISRFQPVTGRSFRIVINTQNTKYIGKLFIGLSTQMPPMDVSQKVKFETTRKPSRSLSGQLYVSTSGYEVTGFDVSFPVMNDEHVKTVKRLWNNVKNQKAFFTLLWGNRPDKVPLLFAVLEQDGLEIERNDNKSFPHKTKISVKEVL